MKWLALLFLVVLAKDLGGHQYPEGKGENQNEHDREKISILKMNPTLIIDEFVDGAETCPPPTIEHGDYGAERFKKDFNQAASRWGREYDNVVYGQGVAAGQNLIDDVENSYDKLMISIGQSSKKGSENNNAEEDLEYLVNQLKRLLALKPGNQTIEHKPFPELPKIPSPIVSQTKNRTASDFFLHLPEFFDEDMSSIYGYVADIYLRGWYNTRKCFDIKQAEYRNQILNNRVLPAYRKVVDKVFKNRDSIQSCVCRDTWSSFENSGHLIIKISNKWLRTLT